MSAGGGAGPLVPTFHGFVQNSMDGLVLFEACLSGKLHHVPRRPHDRERNQLIKSGSIFIYEENASGIKRWTDGVAWSPSRILGNFLIYRELEKPFPPGEKKRAMKRKRVSVPGEPYPRRDSDENANPEQPTPITPPTPGGGNDVKSEIPSSEQDKEIERSLIGSLVDSYGFRPDGLVKKTMSISINGISHHMVSYYKVDDVKNNLLPRPLSDHRLQNLTVRPELYLKQNFRAPVEETDHYAIDGQMHAHPQVMYSNMQQSPYAIRPGQYFGTQQYPNVYGVAATGAGAYGGMTGTTWAHQAPATSGTMAYGSHPAYAGQPYGSGYYRTSVTQSATPSVKAEDPQATSPAMQYGNQYSNSYANMPRSSSQSAPSMGQSPYQASIPQSSGSFGAMTARASYGGQPPAAGQPAQQYGGASSQSYAVRSPTQNYSMQSAPGAVAQSPHQAGVKSPHSANPQNLPGHPVGGSDGQSQLSYRTGSYGTSATGPDVNGLGINGAPAYGAPPPPPPQGHEYQGYGSSGQGYRPVSEIGATQSGGHYAS